MPTITTQSWTKAKYSHNPLVIQKPRTDPGGTSGKNPSDELVKPGQEVAKSVIETSSKV